MSGRGVGTKRREVGLRHMPSIGIAIDELWSAEVNLPPGSTMGVEHGGGGGPSGVDALPKHHLEGTGDLMGGDRAGRGVEMRGAGWCESSGRGWD